MLFRSVDESDATFLSKPDIQSDLETGYNEFRRFACQIDSTRFVKTHAFKLTGKNTYDLQAAQIPINRIIRIWYPNKPPAVGDVTAANMPLGLFVLRSCKSIDDMINTTSYFPFIASMTTTCPASYFLTGNQLRFNISVECTLCMDYEEASTVDWTNPTAEVDVMQQWGDLVVMMATRPYWISNGAISDVLEKQMETRKLQMTAFLTQGLDQDYGGSVNLVAPN